MNVRAIIFALVLIIGLAGGYALSKYQGNARITAAGGDLETEIAHLIDKTVKEEGESYKINLKYPLFGIANIDAAITEKIDAIVVDFRGYVDEEQDPQWPQELSSIYDSTYVGPDIVSGRLAVSSYLGGAHPLTSIHGLNFYRDGRELTLNDALRLIDLSLSEAAKRAGSILSKQLAESYFPEGAVATEQNYSTFVVNADSVIFIFQEYQVGPYAAGPQQVVFARK